MPEIIETTVYRLDELSDAAKDSARAWYRQVGFDHDWYELVYEDFERICDILGIDLKTVPVRLYGGGSRQKTCIWFSGFWSQGDGACFEGRYSHAKGAPRKIRGHAPKDNELHRIADVLRAIQSRNFYQLHAAIAHRDRYYHEYCMAISVERDSPTRQDMTADAEDVVIEALRDLARWLYRQLERDYEYQTSDEAVDEAIIANEYTFTETGRRFGWSIAPLAGRLADLRPRPARLRPPRAAPPAACDVRSWMRHVAGQRASRFRAPGRSRDLRRLTASCLPSVAARTGGETMCKVLNKHGSGIPAEAVYIGRGSKWGNPFRIGRDGDRAAVIARYERWLADQHRLLRALDELGGRDLVCFCAPRPCHGDLLLRLGNATREARIAWWRAVRAAA